MEVAHGRGYVYSIQYHMVWCVKYRHKLISRQIEKRLAEILNKIGKMLEEKYQVTFLPSDFKKKNGYKESIELSKKYHLYRQDYCGCIFSKEEREQQKKIKLEN